MQRVADYIMDRLVEAGARHLFMVTGRGVLYLSDAAAKKEEIECVSVHHEQAGAYAAMSYSQYNETMGACLVTTGCASTNAITPVLCAWQDEVPMIVISGNNMLHETVHYTGLPIRTFGQQEANVVDMVRHITKFATMLHDPKDIAKVMDEAFLKAASGRKGPVWIDVPLDLQNARIDPENLERYQIEEESMIPKKEDIDAIVQKLNGAKRPVILFGSAVRSSNCIDSIIKLVEKYKYPTVTTNSAVDVYSTGNSLAMGVLSIMAGNRAANFAVQNCDFLLVLGNRLTTMATDNVPSKFAREAKIYVVDIDEHEHQKGNIRVDRMIKSDLKLMAEALSKQALNETNVEWQNKCKEWKKIFPKCEDCYRQSDRIDIYELAEALSEAMEENDVFVTDAGLAELILPNNITFKNGQRCLHPVNQGAMGYGLPATIGAWYSSKRNVIGVTGDGSVMMNLQEFQTISHLNIPVKNIIINNDCYAVIRARQEDLFRTRTVGTDAKNGVASANFEKVAACFDILYVKICKGDDIVAKLKEVIQTDGPVICEVIANDKQKYLHGSYRRNRQGKLVQPPLEDQSPFLDRELFLQQMIIEPIDL